VRDVNDVRKAKERLKSLVQGEPWYRGIGISPQPDGPVLRLNIAADTPASANIPSEFEGIPIESVRVDGYSAK
jgi:hypothetical protein